MIGLFLGDTDFSEIILKKILQLKKQYFILHFSKSNTFQHHLNSTLIRIIKFAELINMCTSLGVMPTSKYGERDFDPKISYWTVLKEKYMKDNPGIITIDNYKEKK